MGTLAAASLGLVHHAALHDDTEVAVKVQRLNLDRQVHAELGTAAVLVISYVGRLFPRHRDRQK